MNNHLIKPAPLVEKFESVALRGEALDIGAGRGDNAIFLAQKGFSVTAIEIKKEAAEIIESRAKENEVSLNVVNQDAKIFPIEKDRYTFISTMNSLNFFSKEEFSALIENIKQGLKKEGVCVIAMFTSNDPMCEEVKVKTRGTLENEMGKKWYFPAPNELKGIFEKDFTILFSVEEVVEDKGHPGNEEPHQHAVARIAVKK